MLVGLIIPQSTTHHKKIRTSCQLEDSSPSDTQGCLDLIKGHQSAGTKKEHAAGLPVATETALAAFARSAAATARGKAAPKPPLAGCQGIPNAAAWLAWRFEWLPCLAGSCLPGQLSTTAILGALQCILRAHAALRHEQPAKTSHLVQSRVTAHPSHLCFNRMSTVHGATANGILL